MSCSKLKLSIISFAFLISVQAFSALEKKTEDQEGSYVLCKNAKIVRTLRIETDDADNKCVALYTKAGVDREVGRGQYLSTCVQVVDNIKGNLEKANWKCKELNNVSFSSSIDD